MDKVAMIRCLIDEFRKWNAAWEAFDKGQKPKPQSVDEFVAELAAKPDLTELKCKKSDCGEGSATFREVVTEWLDQRMELLRGLCEAKRIVDIPEMLIALGLQVTPDGALWSIRNGYPCQPLSWTAEEAIAYTVGKMLEPEVFERITQPHSCRDESAMDI